MRQVVRITTDKKQDAKCISNALIAYESKVEKEGSRWSVHVSASTAPDLTALLGALKECLDENAIAMVNIVLDDRAYAMEGTY